MIGPDDQLVEVDSVRVATELGREGLPESAELAAVSYTHLRAHETVLDLVCRLLLEKKKRLDYTHIRDDEQESSTNSLRHD